MFEYKIKKNGKKLGESDEDLLVCFLKMLDFSAKYLHEKYEAGKIKFCPEKKVIYLDDTLRHNNAVDTVSSYYGFRLQNK